MLYGVGMTDYGGGGVVLLTDNVGFKLYSLWGVLLTDVK